jgi:hypothetical protein
MITDGLAVDVPFRLALLSVRIGADGSPRDERSHHAYRLFPAPDDHRVVRTSVGTRANTVTCERSNTMRSISAICGAIVATVCLAPSNVTAANAAQEAVGQSSETTTTAEAPKPPKPEKQHVTTQHVVESTTTVEPPKPPKPVKQHVTTQHVVESTTTVEPPKPPKPVKQHVTKQHVEESTTTVEVPSPEPR